MEGRFLSMILVPNREAIAEMLKIEEAEAKASEETSSAEADAPEETSQAEGA